jgi:hypothetical protein
MKEEEIEEKENELIARQCAAQCVDRDASETIRACRDYLALYGKERKGEELTLPATVDVVDGYLDLRAAIAARGMSLNDFVQLEIPYRFADVALYECARLRDVDVSDVYSDKLNKLAEKIGGGDIFVAKDDTCYFVRNPTAYKIDSAGRRHCEDGPYLAYHDGGKLYALEDIIVPEWVVTQKTATAEQIMSLDDVDVRAIAIRKFGAAPFDDEGELVEKAIIEGADGGENEYKLISLDDAIPGLKKSRYLSMESRCTPGLRHVEGVEGDTVQDALDFRARIGLSIVPGHWHPSSIDGFKDPKGNPDQKQQGDVCLIRLQEDFVRDGYEQLNGRDFVLSPENQKRHHLEGSYTLYEKDGGEMQILFCPDGCVLRHPEHGRLSVPAGKWIVFPTSEKDWVKETIHVTLD